MSTSTASVGTFANGTSRIRSRFLILILLILFVFAVWRLYSSFVKGIPINEGSAWLETPGPLATFHDSLYKIHYRTKDGKEGVIVLRGNVDENPALFLCPKEGSMFYCIYDCDDTFRLIKIDIAKGYQPLASSSNLKSLVASTPVLIQEGDADDWHSVKYYLSHPHDTSMNSLWMPTLDLGVFAAYESRTNLTTRIRSQYQ